jgi:hypothetical protein
MNKLSYSLRLFLLLGIERYASNTSHGGYFGINPVRGEKEFGTRHLTWREWWCRFHYSAPFGA